jgi:hypothetical protein
MAKTNNLTPISVFHSGSGAGVSALPDRQSAGRMLAAVVAELRKALAAEGEHQDLVRRSAQQLTTMGLSHSTLADHIRRCHYA